VAQRRNQGHQLQAREVGRNLRAEMTAMQFYLGRRRIGLFLDGESGVDPRRPGSTWKLLALRWSKVVPHFQHLNTACVDRIPHLGHAVQRVGDCVGLGPQACAPLLTGPRNDGIAEFEADSSPSVDRRDLTTSMIA
jgi:hypothetical protein